jgi:hypothetical protein
MQKNTTTKWPIVSRDSSLLTIDDLKEKCGLSTGGNLRKWIIKQGFSFSLARVGGRNQLCLVVTPEQWKEIKAKREALGFEVK